VLRETGSVREYENFKKKLLDTYKSGSLADITTLVTREFEGKVHRLDDLFVDEQRRIIGIVLQDRIEDYQRTFERLVHQDDDVLARLGRMNYPIPKPLRAAASSYLDLQLTENLVGLDSDGSLDRIQSFYERGKGWGYQPERDLLTRTFAEALAETLGAIGPNADLPALAKRASQLLAAARLLGITLDLWKVQNQLLDAFLQLSDAGALNQPLRDVFLELADNLKVSREVLGWLP
jgi:hypothetical protein